MFRAVKWAAAVAVVGASVWAGFALTAQEPKPAADARAADLTALREAVAAAAKRGDNVDEVRKALDAFEKALPNLKPGGDVPAELQALRNAVDAAAKQGENVDAIAKELAAVELAVAGRSLARPKPQPQPERPRDPFNPPPFNPAPFPAPNFPAPGLPGLDADAVQKAMDLRLKALELLAQNPRDPEAQKLFQEANDQMMRAMRGALGAARPAPLVPFPALPELGGPNFGRANDRPRLGINIERLNAVTADQLGLDPGVGIAVTGVLPGSVAEKAGLRVHDVIVSFAGQPASGNADEFIRQVGEAKAGEKLDVVVLRKGKKVEVKGVVLPEVGAGRPGAGKPLPPDDEPADPPARPGFGKPLPAPPVAPLPPLLPLPLKPNAPGTPLPAPPAPAIDGVLDIRADAQPDLSDLRDAVTAANKKGENVGDIRDALAALEKALGTAALKPGEAPPELAALREAVEAAAKKGENVAAISKELGLVEKALTGRAYERPAPPAPRPDPVRPFPRREGIVIGGGGRVVIGGAGNDFNAMSVTITNGSFTVRARRGDVTYTVVGPADATAPPKITIKDGDKTIEADDLKKVPEEHRPVVERLLKTVNR